MSGTLPTKPGLAGRPLRVGVVGTGYWATWCHGSVLAARDDVELVGFWGRDIDHARRAASVVGAGSGYDDLAVFLDEVDAVSFAVSPEVQASAAIRAARAGKHLLLDKPLSLDLSAADEVVAEVASGGVTSISFMTLLFQRRVREWLTFIRRLADEYGAWDGASVTWAGRIDAAGSPYANSTWRRDRGGLWDLGPHALSLIEQLLPPMDALSATRGPRDTVHLVSHHDNDSLSTVTVTITTPPGTEEADVAVWGPAGRLRLDLPTDSLREAYSCAVDEWLDAIAIHGTHDLDVGYGRHLVALLDAAERSLAHGMTTRLA